MKPEPVSTQTTDSSGPISPCSTPRRTAASVTAPLGSIMRPSSPRRLTASRIRASSTAMAAPSEARTESSARLPRRPGSAAARALATVARFSTGATVGSFFRHDSTMGAHGAACTSVIRGTRSIQPSSRSSLKPFQVFTSDIPPAAGCSTRSGARQPRSWAIS